MITEDAMQLGAYMSLKREDWSEDQWIPSDWNPSGQIGVIDHILQNLRQWVSTVRQYGEELKAAYSLDDGQYRHELHPDDFMLEIGVIENPTRCQANIELLPASNQILGLFPLPSSIKLFNLACDIEDITWEFIWNKTSDDRWVGNLSNWYDPYDDSIDRATYAHNAGDLLIRFAGEMENRIIPEISRIRQEWVSEVEAMEGYAEQEFMTTVMNDYADDSVRYSGDVATLAEDAIDSIGVATNTRAIDEIKYATDALRELMNNFPEESELKVEDHASLASAVDDLNEISSRKTHHDIRGWSGRSTQKQDAMVALDKVRSYWSKRSVDLSSPKSMLKSYRKAQKDHVGTVPSYRFKVGHMVKVKQSRRYGKVVGVRLEGGTGKQIYDIRVNGIDNIKKYYVNELERAD